MITFDSSKTQVILIQEPREATDFTTKEQRKDKETGAPLFEYSVLALGEGSMPAQIKVRAPKAQKAAATIGGRLAFSGLRGVLYMRDGDRDARSVSFTAGAVEGAAS